MTDDPNQRHVPVVSDESVASAASGLSPTVLAALLSVPVAVLGFGLFLLLRDVSGVSSTPGLPSVAGATADGAVVRAAAGPTSAPRSAGLNAAVEGASPQGGSVEAGPALPDVSPNTPWKALPPDTVLTRIGIGSCLSQRHPQPIWSGVLSLEQRPQVFLMIGDNVYGDIKSDDYRELIGAYWAQGSHREFAKAREALPMLATWDDHDYGANDAGQSFPHREVAARLFRDFWQVDTGRPPGDGIHYARTFGPEGRRVQMIFLDTRSFRGDLKRKTPGFPHWGRYEPSDDTTQNLLGEAQWAWLEDRLKEPADVRIIASSIQVMAEGHGFERWGNLPHERSRLMDLIQTTGAKGVVFVSGDRHAGAIYAETLGGKSGKTDDALGASPPATGQIVAELTTSSLNRSYGPSKDAKRPPLVSKVFNQENFGLVDIDWENRALEVSLRGMAGETLARQRYAFDELGIGG